MLGGIKAKTIVLPISSDKMFPPADCAAEQALIPGSELKVLEADSGHIGLFSLDATYGEQIDGHLKALLAA